MYELELGICIELFVEIVGLFLENVLEVIGFVVGVRVICSELVVEVFVGIGCFFSISYVADVSFVDFK